MRVKTSNLEADWRFYPRYPAYPCRKKLQGLSVKALVGRDVQDKQDEGQNLKPGSRLEVLSQISCVSLQKKASRSVS